MSDSALNPAAGSRVARLAWADGLLRASILMYALGLARALFTRTGTSLGSIALLQYDVPHAQILRAEQAGAVLVLVLAVTVVLRPTVFALLAIASLAFVESLAAVRSGGFHFAEYAPYAQAMRYLTPLALVALVWRIQGTLSITSRSRVSAWILRVGLAIVFAIHGHEAWRLHPRFIDFIISTGGLAGMEISEATAGSALRGIAVVDLISAVLILARVSPLLLGWLSFWGLATALSRPLSFGFASYPEVLLRASHFLAPIAIGMLVSAPRRVPPD